MAPRMWVGRVVVGFGPARAEIHSFAYPDPDQDGGPPADPRDIRAAISMEMDRVMPDSTEYAFRDMRLVERFTIEGRLLLGAPDGNS